MKKVKFFSDADIMTLQNKINEWLSENKNIDVLETNFNALNATDANKKASEKYTFYILYSIINQEAKEITELIEQNSPTIEVTEVKPKVLKPSN